MSYSIIAFSVYILLGVMIQKEEFYIFGPMSRKSTN